MSLCRKTKTNAPLMYEVPNKDMMKSEIMPHSSVAKHGYAPQSNLAGVCSIHSLQVESLLFTSWKSLSSGTKWGKSKAHFFMFHLFLCQNGRIYVKTRRVNVFVKPNEQCRACSDIVMARKRTFRGTRKERLIRSPVHSLAYPFVHLLTCPLVDLSTRHPL